MFFAKIIRTANVDETAVLGEARKIITSRIEDPSRRTFLMRSLTQGGVAMLSGCSLGDDDQVESALASISRFNDRVQGWLFDPHVLAPEYPAAMITRPFPFNAFYGIDDVPVVEADTYRLEVTGKVADKRSWSLEALHAMAQVDQITRHICVEGWSAIGRWEGVRFCDQSKILQRLAACSRYNQRFAMKKISTVVLALSLMAGIANVSAADSMAKDEMSKDAMRKDAMTKDSMTKDAMKKDEMAR